MRPALKEHPGDTVTIDQIKADQDNLVNALQKVNVTGKVTTGRICIDSGGSIDVVEDVIIRDRQHLSEDGIILPIIALNKRTGKIEGPPEIVMRGFAVDDPQVLGEARAIVQRTLENSSIEERQDYGVMKEKIRNDLKRFIQKSTSRRPLIMPVIMEI